MRKLSSLAAISAASILFSSVSAAQTGDNDYDFQWAPMNDAAANFYVSGKGFLGAFTGQGPSFGSAWRKCYSVDITQGGKNQSDSQFESSWFRIFQGWSAQNTLQGLNIGIVSLHAASDSDLGGDACLSPWFSSVGNTGGHIVVAAADPGLQAFTSPNPFPSFWDLAFQWNVDPVSGQTLSVAGPNTVGVDAANPFGAPLLANVIFEMQGPSVAGLQDEQYYLITGVENTGLGLATAFLGRGTGGVTNGNSAWGSTLTGVGPDASGLVSHSRWLAENGGGLTAGAVPVTAGPATEILGHVAFSTPFLWAENNGSIGSGGADWNIASGVPSTVQVWLKDIQAGAEGTADVDYKLGGGGVAGAAFNPNLILNFGYFLWSTTAANTMAQRPMSWSDAFGAPTAGSVPVNTFREGAQTLPINFDGLTNSLLNLPGLSQGTPFSGADSVLFDVLGAGNPGPALFEGDFNNTDPYSSGISKLSIAGGNAFPVAGAPIPGFGGLNIGLAAVGVQIVNAGGVAALRLTEFGNGLTLTLQ